MKQNKEKKIIRNLNILVIILLAIIVFCQIAFLTFPNTNSWIFNDVTYDYTWQILGIFSAVAMFSLIFYLFPQVKLKKIYLILIVVTCSYIFLHIVNWIILLNISPTQTNEKIVVVFFTLINIGYLVFYIWLLKFLLKSDLIINL